MSYRLVNASIAGFNGVSNYYEGKTSEEPNKIFKKGDIVLVN